MTTIPGTGNAAVMIDPTTATLSGGTTKDQTEFVSFDGFRNGKTATINLNNTTAQPYNLSFEAGTKRGDAKAQIVISDASNSEVFNTTISLNNTDDWETYEPYEAYIASLPAGDLTMVVTMLSTGNDYTANTRYWTFTPTTAKTVYTLNIDNDASIGTVTATPSGTSFVPDTEITLTAQPKNDYQYAFKNWTDGDDNVVSTDNPYTFKMTANTALKANYEQKDVTIVIPSTAANPFVLEKGIIQATDSRAQYLSGHTDYVGTYNTDKVVYTLRSTEAHAYIISFTASTNNGEAGLNFTITNSADAEVFNKDIEVKNDGWSTFNAYALSKTDVLPAGDYTLTVNFNKGGVNLKSIAFDVAAITIDAAGYATYYGAEAIKVPAGLTAYTGQVDGDKLTLTAISDGIIPAETAVIVKGSAGSYDIEAATEAGTATKGDLQGVLVATATPADTYVLAAEGGVVAFYKYTGTTLAAHKAYLVHASGSARIDLGFADATAIESVRSTETAEDRVFNLAGQRVSKPTRGLYIVNGKKVVVK